jgi:hypothetical protein
MESAIAPFRGWEMISYWLPRLAPLVPAPLDTFVRLPGEDSKRFFGRRR